MLEQSRRQGASIFIYLIFGLLIVIFVINFNPGAGGGQSGCSGTDNTVIRVDGKDVPYTKDGKTLTLRAALADLASRGDVGTGGLVELDTDGRPLR